jgi:hypothetical protein
MGSRNWVNDHAKAATWIVALVACGAIALIVVQLRGARQTFRDKLPEAYFTIDDGKTFFAFGSENFPPFEYKGKQAVRAYVFECSAKERFVGYLERYTPEARKKMMAGKDAGPQTQIYGRELKKPGEAAWVKSGDFAAVARVTDIKCPGGHGGFPEMVEP